MIKFGQNGSFSSIFNLQSKWMNFTLGLLLQNTKVITLLIGQKWLIFITLQSAINLNELNCGHYRAKHKTCKLCN